MWISLYRGAEDLLCLSKLPFRVIERAECQLRRRSAGMLTNCLPELLFSLL
jgi:hypothetical protein